MFRKIFGFFLFFFMVISFYLYIAGVRQLDLQSSMTWLRTVSNRFANFSGIRIPSIPEWTVTLPGDPSWYEYIPVMLSFIVNFLVNVANTVVNGINFIGDIFKMVGIIVWTFFESWTYFVPSA